MTSGPGPERRLAVPLPGGALRQLTQAELAAVNLMSFAQARDPKSMERHSIAIAAHVGADPTIIPRLVGVAYDKPGLFGDPATEEQQRVEPSLKGIRQEFPVLTTHPDLNDDVIFGLLKPHPAVAERVTSQLESTRSLAPKDRIRAVESTLRELIVSSRLPIGVPTLIQIVESFHVYQSLIEHIETADVLRSLSRSEEDRLVALGQRLAKPWRLIQADVHDHPEGLPGERHETDEKNAAGLRAARRVLTHFSSALGTFIDDDPTLKKIARQAATAGRGITDELVSVERAIKRRPVPGGPQYDQNNQAEKRDIGQRLGE